jgi:hypothetical protein
MNHHAVSLDSADTRAPPARSLLDIYRAAPYLSVKHDSYFRVYEDLFRSYVGKSFTFVEVGVLNGGSLFMWREYFGPRARIIGVDLNPGAQKWTRNGFEIYIGSQSDAGFWRRFFTEVGTIDVLLDDGGHTNPQQIVTLHETLPHVNDGGMVVVEDVHTSYMREFGNPSRYSFMNFAKAIVDDVNSRSSAVPRTTGTYGRRVHAVSFFESIVAFHVDSRRCLDSRVIANDGISANAEDLRLQGSARGTVEGMVGRWRRSAGVLERIPLLRRLAKFVVDAARKLAVAHDNRRVRNYFG